MNLPPRHSPLAGLSVVSLGAALATMDLAVNVAFPSITATFGLETRSIRWVVICYVLTYSSLMLAFGKLGDRIGHRQVFRAGLVLSALALALCGIADDYETLLAARIVQGVATALVLSCAPALATLLYDEHRRTKALARYSTLTAFASVIAPLIGGASVAALGWSGVFWFRVPLAVLALLLLPLLRSVDPPATRAAPNIAGSVLLATSLAFLMLTPALIETTASPAYALMTGTIGLAALYAFVRHERRAYDPVLPLALMRDVDFLLPNVTAVIVHFVSFAVPLMVPYYLVRTAGYGALESGAVLAFSPAGLLIGSALTARTVAATGARKTALLGATLVCVGSATIAAWPMLPALPVALGSLLLHGIGIGLFHVAYTDLVVAALPRGARGVAGSLTMVTRTVGVMTAATALTALQHQLETRAVAAGTAPAAAFGQTFSAVFVIVTLLLVVFYATTALRRA